MDFFNKFIIIFIFKSFNQFITSSKLPFVPLLHNIDKYFLLFDNNATLCFGVNLKFLHREIIKNSNIDLHKS